MSGGGHPSREMDSRVAPISSDKNRDSMTQLGMSILKMLLTLRVSLYPKSS